jgi:hypothetical protein
MFCEPGMNDTFFHICKARGEGFLVCTDVRSFDKRITVDGATMTGTGPMSVLHGRQPADKLLAQKRGSGSLPG